MAHSTYVSADLPVSNYSKKYIMRTAIIGGGIAGLAAAYELQKANAAFTLFEASNRLGGVIASASANGSVLEDGPDSFLTEKSAATELCRELGLGDALISSNDPARKTYIAVGKRLISLPDGLMFLIPTKLVPTALSPLFSFGTKLRMARELFQPPQLHTEDESVAALVERHFGAEVVDRLAEPLLSGIYGGEAKQLSARAVLPRLVEMENRYGSLTKAMLAVRKAAASRTANGAAPRSTFTTLRGGLQQMIDALAERVPEQSLRLNTPVRAVERIGSAWRITTEAGSEDFDALIVATPAWASAQMLQSVDATLANELAEIPYSSSIAVNLVYDETKLGPLPAGFGFLVPPSSGRIMLACTFAHRKFLGRTAPGKAVLRAFLGGVRNEALLAESDEWLIATARRELAEILGSHVLGMHIEPEEMRVSRWHKSMAQYAVGHLSRVERIRERVSAIPNLHLVGNAYDGIGIPDCIRLGRSAVRQLLETAISF